MKAGIKTWDLNVGYEIFVGMRVRKMCMSEDPREIQTGVTESPYEHRSCSRRPEMTMTHKVFSSVHSLSHVRLFVTPWIAACEASLSITNSQRLLKLMPIESVMPSSHLILCCPLLLLPSIFPSIRVFSKWVSSSHQVAKVLEFQLQYQSFPWTPRTDLL